MLFSLSKSATGSVLDLCEYALLFFGLVLVVGIFGEYKKLPKWFLRWPKELFEILVMIGVAGELLGDGGVFLFSHRLQILEGADIQVLDGKAEKALSDATEAGHKAKAASGEADSAKLESGKAKDAASTAKSLAAGARKEADALTRDIASAKSDASEAKALLSDVRNLASEAQRKAGSALNTVAAERESRKPRSITPEQAETMVAVLIPFKGRHIKLVTSNDGESVAFGEAFKNVLAGTITVDTLMSMVPFSGHGIQLRCQPDAEPFAIAVARALVTTGLSTPIPLNRTGSEGLEMFVGPK